MILRKGKEVQFVVREGKFQEQVNRKAQDREWNTVYPTKFWWEKYGVQADYVISNGIDNWIDTQLAMNTAKDGIVIEINVEYLTITSTEINTFGAVAGSGSSRQVVEAGSIVDGTKAFYGYSSNGTWRITGFEVVPNKRYNLKYEFKSNLQIMYVDDIEVFRTTDTVNLTSANTMTLFARSYSSVRGGFVNAKWHSFKMSNLDGTPIADYMPLYVNKKPIQDQNGTEYPVGSYILVDNVKETATVLYGAPLEGAYIPWWSKYGSATSYVVTNGTNNYIDTNILTQNDLNIEIDLEYLKVDGTSEHLFGGVNGEDDARRVVELGFINGGKLTYAYGYNWTNTNYVPEQDTPYKLRAEFTDGLQVMYVNDAEEHRTTTSINMDKPISMYLFSRNEFGTPSTNMAEVKIKSCIVSKPNGEILLDYIPIYLDKQEMTDDNNRVYPVGSFVLVDNISEKITKLYGDELTGASSLPYSLIDGITFNDGQTYPYMQLGKWSDYNTVDMTFSTNDTSNADVFFGASADTGFIGYADTDTMIVNSNLSLEAYTVTPNLTATEKGDGTDKTIQIKYNSTNENPFTFGAYQTTDYSKGKILKSIVLLHTGTGISIVGKPAVLKQDYQGYVAGTVGLIDENTGVFYGSADPTYNFIPIDEPSTYDKYGELVESIQNADIESYIDTGYVPVGNEIISVTMNIPVDMVFDTGDPYIFGNYTDDANTFGLRLHRTSSDTNQIKYDPADYPNVFSAGTGTRTGIINLNSKTASWGTSTSGLQDDPLPIQTKSVYLFTANNYPTRTIVPPINKFEISGKMELVPLKITKMPIADASGRVHNIGSYVMFDLISNTVPTHIGNFTGGETISNWWEEYGEKAVAVVMDGTTNFVDTEVVIPYDARPSFVLKGRRLSFDKKEIFLGAKFGESSEYNSLINLGVNEDNFVIVDASTIETPELVTDVTLGRADLLDAQPSILPLASTSRVYVRSSGNPYIAKVFQNVILNPTQNNYNLYFFALNDNGIATYHANVEVEEVGFNGINYKPLKITKKDLISERGNIYPVGSYALVNYDEKKIAHVGGNPLSGLDSYGELAYTLSDDSTYYINTGRGENTSTQIFVPEIYKGLPVKEIAENAYKDDINLHYIEFDTITSIGNSAFEGSGVYEFTRNIRNIAFGENVFKNCINIKSRDLSVFYNIPNGMFEGCINLETIEVATYTETIGARAFKGCVKLTNCEISSATVLIGEEAFAGCTSLATLDLQPCLAKHIKIANANAIPNEIENIIVPNYLLYDYHNDTVWQNVPSYQTKIDYIKNYTEFAEHANYVVADGTQYVNTQSTIRGNEGYTHLRASCEENQGGYLLGFIDRDDLTHNTSVACINHKWIINVENAFVLGDNVPNSVNYIYWNKYWDETEFNGIEQQLEYIYAGEEIAFVLNRNNAYGEPYDSNFIGKIYNIVEREAFNYQPIRLTQDYGGYLAGSYVLWDMLNAKIPEIIGTFNAGG